MITGRRVEDGVSGELTRDLGLRDNGSSPSRRGGVAARHGLRASQACPPSHSKGVSHMSAGWLGAVSHAQGFKLESIIIRKPFKAFK